MRGLELKCEFFRVRSRLKEGLLLESPPDLVLDGKYPLSPGDPDPLTFPLLRPPPIMDTAPMNAQVTGASRIFSQ
jgi:hypothetical protein